MSGDNDSFETEPAPRGSATEQLPADLRPGDDNPLAEPLEDGEELEGASLDDLG